MPRGKLFSINSRISSINSIFNISKAMELVSSSKFNTMQHLLENSTKYCNEFENIISKIENPLLKKEKRIMLIVVASDKGLCGSYNNNILKFFREYYNQNMKNKISLLDDILIIGKKIIPSIKKDLKMIKEYSSLENIFTLSSNIAEIAYEKILKGIDVIMIYTNYKVFKTNILVESLLPALNKKEDEFLIEPNNKEIFNKIFPIYLRFKINRNILSSLTSENYLRMISMNNASDSADELFKSLKMYYNKERQTIITQEILEVISGAENSDEF